MPPIDYKSYHPQWKTKIRPDILERDGYCCKFCKVPNKTFICRGKWGENEVWQNDDGQIFDAKDGKYIGSAYVGDVWVKNKRIVTKIVLTIAHLNHDITNNDYDNLAALCQKCHNNYDKSYRKANSRETLEKKKKLQKLF